MRDARGILERLLALTPEPPGITVDPSEVFERADRLLVQRAAYLAELGIPEGEFVDAGEYAALRDELASRNQRWSAALQRARHHLGLRLGSVGRVASVYGG